MTCDNIIQQEPTAYLKTLARKNREELMQEMKALIQKHSTYISSLMNNIPQQRTTRMKSATKNVNFETETAKSMAERKSITAKHKKQQDNNLQSLVTQLEQTTIQLKILQHRLKHILNNKKTQREKR